MLAKPTSTFQLTIQGERCIMFLTQSSKIIFAIIVACVVVISAFLFFPQFSDAQRAEAAALIAIKGTPFEYTEYLGEAEISIDDYLYERPEKRESHPFSDSQITSYRFFEFQHSGRILTIAMYKSPIDGEWRPAW